MTRAGFLTDAHRELAMQAQAFASTLRRDMSDETVLDALRRSGLFRHLFPKQFGGHGDTIDLLSICVIREALAGCHAGADSIFAVQGLGAHAVLLSGDSRLQDSVLPSAARGTFICAFALTEPEAGSDVKALRTTAKRKGNSYVLDGHKRFISNAGIATHYTVFARTPDAGPDSISAFWVAAETPGLSVKPMHLLGEHPIGEVTFHNCEVPESFRIGAEGSGLKLALGTLDSFRPTVGAAAVGMGQRALDEATTYAMTRIQFGAPLSSLGAVQGLLAESAAELEAARLLVHMAAATKNSGQARIGYEAAVSKMFATEAAQRVVDRCLQVHSGAGLLRGHPLEALYRDVRALRIYEGSTEVQKTIIARHLVSAGTA